MTNIGEYFTFKAGLIRFESRRPTRQLMGFRAFNSHSKEVGAVWCNDDERGAAYGYCELFFYRDYCGRVWHRFRTNGQRLSWKFLQNYLSTHDEYTCYID